MRKYELALRDFHWFRTIRDKLDFEQEVMNVSINYTRRNCEISTRLYIPPSKHDKLKKIELPKYDEYEIKDILNSSFESIKELFYLSDNKYICNAKIIPQFDDKILLILEGTMRIDFLNRLIRVQPAMNRDQTEELDRYWLDIMIRDMDMWDKIWLSMDVEDVDLPVDVSLDRVFSVVLPPAVQRRWKATQKYLEAGRGRSRDNLMRAWSTMRTAVHENAFTVDEIMEIGRKLLEPNNFHSYLEIEEPYRIGGIEKTSQRSRSVPENIVVTARTDLNYEDPIAKGYLTFKKKLFTEAFEEAILKRT